MPKAVPESRLGTVSARAPKAGVEGLTDGSGVDLNSGVEVSEETNGVGTFRDGGAGNGEATKGEEGEVCETHCGSRF